MDKDKQKDLFVNKNNNLNDVNGAPTRTRTADLLITNQLLYQLSYRGTGEASFALLAK